MDKSQMNTIASIKIFNGCSSEFIRHYIIHSGRVETYTPGTEFFLTAQDSSPVIGVLLSGRCVIYSSDKERNTLLRFVSPGDAVGVAGIFADTPPNTRIFACGDTNSEVFFFNRNALINLIDSEPDGCVKYNLLRFISNKISFLNSRIDCVTGGSAERRLAIFIKSSPKINGNTIKIGMTMTSLAQALDIGRASLYRAFDSLESAGAISRQKGTVTIYDNSYLDELC